MKLFAKSTILIFMSLFFLTGCSMTTQSEVSIEEKSYQELCYIEDIVFNISNQYAKGEFIQEDDTLNWNAILDEEKKINRSIETIVLDLSELNVPKEDILSLSNELNQLVIATSSENQDELFTRLNQFYAIVPKSLEQFWQNKNEIQDKQLKSMVLSSYALANKENWQEAKTTIQSAVDKYNGMMNDVEYMQENSYKLNKIYVLLGEVKNAVDMENIDLLNLKFVNFIEKI